MANSPSSPIARRMQSSPAGQSDMIDQAISDLHSNDDIPPHIGVPAMHALLLAKHFHSKGLKVPDHLKDPPPVGPATQTPDNNGQEAKSEEDTGGEDDGD